MIRLPNHRVTFMRRMLWRRYLAGVALAVVLGACSTMRPVMEWQDESYSGRFDSVLVLAAAEDSVRRRSFEDACVEEFAGLGVRAVPAYEVVGDRSELSRESIEAAIAGRDIDAVLVTRLLGVEQVEEYQPPTGISHYRGYHRYYAHALQYSSPGYYRNYELLTLETTLYDTATGKLVWSMQSESIDTSARDLIDAQIALTIERLAAAGLLSPPAE